MKDEIALNALCEMIDHCVQERAIPTAQSSESSNAQKEDQLRVQTKCAN